MEFDKKKANIKVMKVIHNQTNLQQKLTNCLRVFGNSAGLALKGFTASFSELKPSHIFLKIYLAML